MWERDSVWELKADTLFSPSCERTSTLVMCFLWPLQFTPFTFGKPHVGVLSSTWLSNVFQKLLLLPLQANWYFSGLVTAETWNSKMIWGYFKLWLRIFSKISVRSENNNNDADNAGQRLLGLIKDCAQNRLIFIILRCVPRYRSDLRDSNALTLFEDKLKILIF